LGLNPQSNTRSSGRAKASAGSRWLPRCLLMVGGPLVFVLASEAALRIAGYGKRTDLFIPDVQSGFYRTNPDFTVPFFPPQFDITPLNFRIARRKEPGHLRIFVLGESAVRGTPVPGFGFASQLRAQLRAAYPARQFEVYNLGIVAINSHVVYQMARQVADLEPDLFVVYMGNNEVVGPYGPGSANLSVMPPLFVIRASIWTGGTRMGQLILRLIGRFATPASHPADWRGMGTFTENIVRGDDPRLDTVYRNYEANLRDIVRIASRRGIRTVLATAVANLRDSPPFASLHSAAVTGPQLASWNSSYQKGERLWELGSLDGAIESLGESLKIDPDYADAHYLLGRLLEEKGDIAGARIHFLEALHWDALRFRPDARINAIARSVASDSPESVLLADTALEMGSDAASAAPPSGRETLLEHVHFNWEGNRRVGRMLAEKSAAALFGAGAPPGKWLDGAGCAEAVGFTEFGRMRMLGLMEPIWSKPPFTGQITFGEDQVRHKRELELAAAAATSGDGIARARAMLEAALMRDPDNPDLALRLSEVESESKQPERSLPWIDRVLGLEPRSPELLVQRSRILMSLGRHGEAQATLLESLSMDPYHLPSYTALVEVLRKTGDFETGRTILAAALAKNPNSSYIRLTYADLLFFHGNRDEAVNECRVALARDPQNQDALRRLVSLYTGEGQKEQAVALMSEATRTQPLNFENNMALARIYGERNDDNSVADCLTEAALSGPAGPEVHLYLASHLRKLNRPKDALVELARAERVAILMGNTELAQRISAEIRSRASDN
jgi:tetratricopeptide (TPR) repeat protein